jgi:hypothetical protein
LRRPESNAAAFFCFDPPRDMLAYLVQRVGFNSLKTCPDKVVGDKFTGASPGARLRGHRAWTRFPWVCPAGGRTGARSKPSNQFGHGARSGIGLPTQLSGLAEYAWPLLGSHAGKQQAMSKIRPLGHSSQMALTGGFCGACRRRGLPRDYQPRGLAGPVQQDSGSPGTAPIAVAVSAWN